MAVDNKYANQAKITKFPIREHTMEQMNLSRKDLEKYIGSKGRVSEVLNHQRGLSLNMIRNLHAGLHIPLESLVG